jgi:hypothetical protein
MKKTLAILLGALLAVPLAQAQVETGTSGGAQALDEARSGAISAGRTTTENVSVAAGQVGSKEVVVVEEDEKWWSLNVGTGWDSLYMFRGANILGNGNGIYWLSAGLGVTPWENGELTANFWYGVGSWWNGINPQERYGEVNVSVGYSHSFGALTLSTGWIYYYFPNTAGANDANGVPMSSSTSQNEIYFGAAYDIEVGSITITPNATYYYNLGPEWGQPGGFAYGGSSYLNLGVSSEIPIAYDGAVALAPYTQFGYNFGFNQRYSGGTYPRFIAGNSWQTGVALPIQFTSWLSVSPYIAYSYQWQNLPTYVTSGWNNNLETAVNTFWGGISANVSF